MTISLICAKCGGEHTLECDEQGYNRWISGMRIKYALPTLNDTEKCQLRDLLCPPCQLDPPEWLGDEEFEWYAEPLYGNEVIDYDEEAV